MATEKKVQVIERKPAIDKPKRVVQAIKTDRPATSIPVKSQSEPVNKSKSTDKPGA